VYVMPAPGFKHGGEKYIKELIEGFAVAFILLNVVGGIFPFARLLAVLYIIVSIFNIASKAKYWNTLYMLGFLFTGIFIAILFPQLISLDTVIVLAVIAYFIIGRIV